MSGVFRAVISTTLGAMLGFVLAFLVVLVGLPITPDDAWLLLEAGCVVGAIVGALVALAPLGAEPRA